MSKKVIIHQFDPVIYPRKVWIAITSDLKNISDMFLDKNSKGEMIYIESISNKFHAITQLVTQKETNYLGVVIVFSLKSSITIKNIAHEATHAARIIWDELGEDLTGEEADAYLVGWIAECCEKVKNNKC